MKTTTAQMALDALNTAKTGLIWYAENYPKDSNGSDDEAMQEIDAALVSLEDEVKQERKPIAMMLKHPNGLPSLHFVEGFGAAELSILPKVCSLYAASQEAEVPGMDDKNIANRLDHWFTEGLHKADLALCPYAEDTIAKKWWMRGCNHAIMLFNKEAAPGFTGLSDSADFDAYTWTFKMDPGYRVGAGQYRITPITKPTGSAT